MGRKMTLGHALIALGVGLTVMYLNTLIVWLWPDASLWALAIVLMLSVFAVVWVYRTSRKGTPPAPEDKE